MFPTTISVSRRIRTSHRQCASPSASFRRVQPDPVSLRGHHEIFERIEARLAAFSGTESALLFGSGYAANIGLLQALVSPDDLVLSDERNHASLIDGIRLTKAATRVFPHQDLGALEEALRAPRRGRAIVVTESVFSMDGDCTPLEELCTVAEHGGAAVIVDEAHATGLYGARGSGRVEELGIRDRVLATIHTGGKALGSGGAWVAGSRALRDVLVNRARSFIFSTAPLPVVGAALEAGLQLTEREPGRRADVHRKSLLVRRALAEAGVTRRRPVADRADPRGLERRGACPAVRAVSCRLRRARDPPTFCCPRHGAPARDRALSRPG